MLLFANYFKFLKSTHPVCLAFFASLVLSFIAIQFEVTLSRDAAFYLDLTRSFNEKGLHGLFQFDWPWFLLLLAISHKLTGLALETLAYLWVSLFMATTCALLVDMLVRRIPGSSGWALLVVLAMPAFNQFRGDIIREHGFWCFSMLALWFALRWDERGGWKLAVLMQLSVVLAALFRLEAMLLMPALVLWRILQVRNQDGWLRLAQISWLPIVVAVAGLFALQILDNQYLDRLNNYLYKINPKNLLAQFTQLSDNFSSMLHKWIADDAAAILFFAFLIYILGIFIRLLGPFALPFLFPSSFLRYRIYWQRFQPFALAFILYFLALMVYFFYHLFMNGRYTSYLNLLAVPVATLALMNVAERFPRAVKLLVVISIGVMIANVISLSPKKTHYIEAANWIKQNELPDEASKAFYFEDGRIAYYAGWSYVFPYDQSAEQILNDKNTKQGFSYFVFEENPDTPWLLAWFKQHPGYKILAQFSNGKKNLLIIGNCEENPLAGCKALSAP
ncbi:hypothetical protein AXE65_00145 [Ventosimonas gracilis]|uniref:Glycosyltransferase RgtA/B/C/D-like domain-containing protein n=1 Tax=Ventosimonas gracilis TaxID=1680762 RepID=A0A139SVW4_9GAMM|nr:hypothetical protein [Ventosimonas gracilis]KXU38610.1 hypothetical protein AXE65_00145 [Ventosimonas gracilis]